MCDEQPLESKWVLLLTTGTPVLGDQRDLFETILASLLDMDLGANH